MNFPDRVVLITCVVVRNIGVGGVGVSFEWFWQLVDYEAIMSI